MDEHRNTKVVTINDLVERFNTFDEELRRLEWRIRHKDLIRAVRFLGDLAIAMIRFLVAIVIGLVVLFSIMFIAIHFE